MWFAGEGGLFLTSLKGTAHWLHFSVLFVGDKGEQGAHKPLSSIFWQFYLQNLTKCTNEANLL